MSQIHYKKIFFGNGVLILLTIILILSLNFKIYHQNFLTINNEEVSVLVKLDDLDIWQNNKELYYEKEKYQYKIKSIDSNYQFDEKLNRYALVYLEISLDEKLLFDNNILEVKLIQNDQKIGKYIIDFMLGKEKI